MGFPDQQKSWLGHFNVFETFYIRYSLEINTTSFKQSNVTTLQQSLQLKHRFSA